MRSNVHLRLPPAVRRSLVKLGRDVSVARRKRRITQAMMAERIGVAEATYLRIERGDPSVGIAAFAMTLFVLGLGTPFAELVDAARDDQALLLDVERLPTRVRARKIPTGI
ncbi:MAG TPA: helix-turn-helix domain-containing protein [Gemmatimonadaceae bacterium]